MWFDNFNKLKSRLMLWGFVICVLVFSLGAAKPWRGKTHLFTVTAYCPCVQCCGSNASGITASGYVIQNGDRLIAAPPEFPFGLKMDIPGYGKAAVLDRGGAIRGDKLDIFFPTHQQAMKWGIKRLAVKIE